MVAHGLNRLNHGLTYKGKELPAVKASWQNENRLRFAMKNPQPGVIALFCQAVGLKVVAIRRIRIGGVSIGKVPLGQWRRSEEHTSELQSLMRISYAVFCLKKKHY